MEISHLKTFIGTRTNSLHPLERVGNYLLTPARVLWNGYSIAFLKIKGTSLEQHHGIKAEYEHKYLSTFLGKLVCLAVLIGTLIPGIILKGLAYLSPSVRQNHWKIIDSFAIEQNPPPGITIDEGDETKDPLDFKFRAMTITIDLSAREGEEDKDLVTFIADKLAHLKPHLSFFGATIFFDSLSEISKFPNPSPGTEVEKVRDMLRLHKLIPECPELHLVYERAFDYVSYSSNHRFMPCHLMGQKEIEKIYT